MSRVLHPPRHGASTSSLRAAILTLIVMLPLLASGPATAAPSASSRFWGYYQLTGDAWTFASTGAEQTTPADGSVEGWRFAVADFSAPRYPRAIATFEQACGAVEPVENTKRVGVVIDYGRPADTAESSVTPPAPRVACSQVPTEATGAQVLAAVADLRIENGIVCGLDSYPATGCLEDVATPAPAAAAPDESVTLAAQPSSAAEPAATEEAADQSQNADSTPDAGPDTLTWVAIVLTLLVIAAAIWFSLRRRQSSAARR